MKPIIKTVRNNSEGTGRRLAQGQETSQRMRIAPKNSQPSKKPMTNTNRPIDTITKDLRAAFKEEAANAIKIGGLLLEAKQQLGHGEWLPWLEKEFSMSERTAQRRMQVHAFAKSATLADLKLRVSALYLLSDGTFTSEETAAIIAAAKTEWVGVKKAKSIAAAIKPAATPAEQWPEPPAGDTNLPETSPVRDDEASALAYTEQPAPPLVPEDQPPSLPVSPPPPSPGETYLKERFAAAVLELRKLNTKPSATFAGVIPAADLEIIANFLNQVAAETHAG
jgi:hypothetical protein